MTGCLSARRPHPPVATKNIPTPSTPFHCPLKGAKILSPFGPRGGTYHTGIDIRAKREGGDPVLAAREGKVIFTGNMHGYGQIVILKHADGYNSRYAHLRKILVKKDQRVQALEKIGLVGQTGRATTPHLHFEILTPQGEYTDPLPYLKNAP